MKTHLTICVILCLTGLPFATAISAMADEPFSTVGACTATTNGHPVFAQLGKPRAFTGASEDSLPIHSQQNAWPVQNNTLLLPPLGEVKTNSPTSKIDVKKQSAAARTYTGEELEEAVKKVLKKQQAKAPSYPTAKLTGFFHLDGAYFYQDPLNRATVGDAQDGVSFRRARLAAQGKLAEDVSYIVEFEMANSLPPFVDVWVNFDKVPYLGNIRIGRWRQRFGMSELTSVRALPFMERDLGFVLSPFRQTGIGIFNHCPDERSTWSASVYRYVTDGFGNTIGDNGGYGMTSRVTWLPWYRGDGDLIHVGFDYSYNDPAEDFVFFATPPEVFLSQSIAGFNPTPFFGTPLYADAGIIPTRDTNLFNIEAAAALGPLVFQSEFRWAMVNQLGGPTRTLPAASAHLRYVLTGEVIPYKNKSGVFGRVKPHQPFNWCCGGWGAWEVAGRWSFIDLNGTIGTGPGRALTDLTFGINWYVNDHVRFEFNYIRAFLSDPVLGRSDTDIFAFRTQMDF